MKEFKADDRLPNGATVLEVRPHKQGDRVVLARFKRDELVTWRIDEDGHAYWGHYFLTSPKQFADATSDFRSR